MCIHVLFEILSGEDGFMTNFMHPVNTEKPTQRQRTQKKRGRATAHIGHDLLSNISVYIYISCSYIYKLIAGDKLDGHVQNFDPTCPKNALAIMLTSYPFFLQ